MSRCVPTPSSLALRRELTRARHSPTADGPRYIKGHAVSLSLVGFAAALYGFLWFWLSRKNEARDAGRTSPRHEGLSDDELRELGDESPHFRYIT